MKTALNEISTPLVKRTNTRWIVAFMMWLVIAINYLDRSVLSIAAPYLTKEFSFSAAEMGMIMSAFFWAYALLQLPAGYVADKIGQKKSLSLAVIFWSIATFATGFVNGFKSLLGLRIGLGFGEAGAFPSNVGITSKWFPDKERATVSGIFNSAGSFGSAFGLPIIVWIISTTGWRFAFFICGLLGFIWLILWLIFFKDNPKDHRMVNEAELKYIVDGQSIPLETDEQSNLKWYQLLKYRNVWSVSLGLFVGSYNSYFFITWFPTYLVTQRHVDFLQMGFFATLPPLAGMIAEIFSGWLSDRILSKGILSLTATRRLFLIMGMVLATSIGFAVFANSTITVVLLLCVAKMGTSIAFPQLWAIPGDIAPKNVISTFAGFANTVSNFGGALGPLITGFFVAYTGSFNAALLFSGAMVFFNIFNYSFILKDLKPITSK
ncbi:MAG: MFS transporter [Veillonellales bacterium]